MSKPKYKFNGMLSTYRVDSLFVFPWVHKSYLEGYWYFETVIFHRCINFAARRWHDEE